MTHHHSMKAHHHTLMWYVLIPLLVLLNSVIFYTVYLQYRLNRASVTEVPSDVAAPSPQTGSDPLGEAGDITAVQNSNEPPLVFYITKNDAWVVNLKTNERVKLNSLLPAEPTGVQNTVFASRWSPDGLYLPFIRNTLYVDKQTASKLYFYDAENKSIAEMLQSNDDNYFKLIGSSFSWSTFWLDNRQFAYYMSGGMGPEECNSVTLEGVDSAAKCSRFFATGKLRNYYDDKRLVYDDKDLTFYPEDKILGVLGTDMVTFHWARTEEDEAKDRFRNDTRQLTQEEILQEALIAATTDPKPIEPHTFYLSDLASGTITRTVSYKTDWYLISAQLVPFAPQIIMHVNDNYHQPTREKYVLINLSDGSFRELFTTRANREVTFGNYIWTGTFHLTADGRWIVYKEPTNSGNPFEYQIKSYQLETGTTRVVCEEQCNNLQVYNPYYPQPNAYIVK
ncbi:MAG: hypothetical protein NUV98_07570 [Candidatus Roizmanbacteria bacterium]|nr:hypothetical protein [Candidatus Roizmanbacteria bacterium]